jgi:hypothetical protein
MRGVPSQATCARVDPCHLSRRSRAHAIPLHASALQRTCHISHADCQQENYLESLRQITLSSPERLGSQLHSFTDRLLNDQATDLGFDRCLAVGSPEF